MGSMSIVHWMIVIGVVVLLFGRNKISGLMGDVAQGIKPFKNGMREDASDSPSTSELKPAPIAPDRRISAPIPRSAQQSELNRCMSATRHGTVVSALRESRAE